MKPDGEDIREVTNTLFKEEQKNWKGKTVLDPFSQLKTDKLTTDYILKNYSTKKFFDFQ